MHGCVQRALVAGAVAVVAAPAAAVSLGAVDSFESGADGWHVGIPSPAPPLVMASGGPAGAGDAFLLLGSVGGSGPGNRLTVIAGPQWAGDYAGAGVDRISLDVNNLGATPLDLRLWLQGTGGAGAVSAMAVNVAAGSGWTPISFALDADALLGQPLAALAGVFELRLFHSGSAGFPGPPIVASLGIDNVSAVPEPRSAWIWLSGLLALGSIARCRQRQGGKP